MSATAHIERKITQVNRSVVARECQMDRSYVSEVLNGKRDPGLSVARKVARAVRVTIDELAGYLERKTGATGANLEAVN